MKNMCMVFTFHCNASLKEFLTHIPLRTAETLPPDMKLHVLYQGFLDEGPLIKKGIIVKRIGLSRSFLYFSLFKWAILFWNVLIYGFRGKIDVFINANNHINFLYVAAAALLIKKKRLARVSGEVVSLKPKNRLKKMNQKIKRFKEKISLSLSHDVIVLSGSLKRGLLSRGVSPSKLRVIPQGVDTSLFKFREQKQGESIRIIFVGRLVESKGINQALTAFKEAFNIAAEKYGPISFDIYGNGAERLALEQEWGGHQHIHFHGHVAADDMAGVYETGDIFVMPSFSEGLPNAVMEAMASGVVVIASNVGGIPELLDNGNCGLLVTPGNLREIADAMLTLIREPELRRTIALKARKRVETLYSLNRVRKDFQALLENPESKSKTEK